jgi:DNA helicase II / ATP-dependent DNA helicase PcrA
MSQKQLDVDQHKAVTVDEGPVLVLAGAGSGKTRVLTERIIYLIQHKGFQPTEICALTFTNKAAREMHSRIITALENQNIPVIPASLMITTFHSCAIRVIKDYRDVLGYKLGVTIYDDKDKVNLIKSVCIELGFDPNHYSPKALAKSFALAKESNFESMNEGTINNFPIFERYQQKLKANNALDFSQMLLDWYALLKHPQVSQQLQRRWRYILVDEFQDTNKLQFAILKRLTAEHGNIFAVGDEDQSIYRFRGAVLKNILNFDASFKGAEVIKLRHNYRSTHTILKGAEHVVNHNSYRKVAKEMIPVQGTGEPIVLMNLISDIEEAREVVGRIGQWMLSGKSLNDIAIFYRTHSVSRIFEDILRKSNIPYRVFGGMRFYDRAEIKDVLAYLRLIVNPADEMAFDRVVNTPTRGLGKITLQHVADYGSHHGHSKFEVVQSHLSRVNVSLRARKSLEGFRDIILKFQEWQGKSLSEMVLFLIKESGYHAYLEKDKSPEGQTRTENVQELINAVADYESMESEPSLASFLESLHLDMDVTKLEQGQEATYVSLMTCHAAKGLEFEEVYLVGCEEGVFPHIMRDLSDPQELEEERRLFYVAMTRAKTHLYISMSLQRKVMGFYQAQLPSRFVAEIPESYTHLIDKTYMKPRFQPPAKTYLNGSRKKDFSYEYEPEESEDVGHWVKHSTFGKGKIVAVEGEGENKRFRIQFARYGEKRILASFATLSRLD